MLRVVAVTAGLLLAAPATAHAAAAPTRPATAPSTVTVNGKTFGPQDGLVIEQGSVTVGGAAGTTGITAAASSRYAWGASYATNTETAQFVYDGASYAAANIYGGKRIIQVCDTYRRDGRVLKGPTCSSARYVNGAWRAGSRATSRVTDTLNPWASKTTWSYSTVRVNPSSTGT